MHKQYNYVNIFSFNLNTLDSAYLANEIIMHIVIYTSEDAIRYTYNKSKSPTTSKVNIFLSKISVWFHKKKKQYFFYIF